MSKKILPLFLMLAVPSLFAADHQWVLKQSTLTYHVSHTLHQSEGVSHAARGKGICHEGQCDFLIAVPVKSFDSGDSNRDLHMIQVTRGAEFPMVTVRTHLPESAATATTIQADIEIQFAGQTAHYKQVAFAVVTKGNETELTGTIPATLTDFKIDPPSLLTIPVKNEVPIRVEMTWSPQ
ncbi:MAG TPA: YceI family protein [Candidatus Binatus sp.]|nr:YceI family protein [Candidatus Binatus sp.]